MSAGFTPGPWRVFSARSIRSRHPQHKGCEVAHTAGGWGDDRRMANARLIAAAPELYEALDALLQTSDEDGHYHDLNAVAVDKAERAIAKASGEQVHSDPLPKEVGR